MLPPFSSVTIIAVSWFSYSCYRADTFNGLSAVLFYRVFRFRTKGMKGNFENKNVYRGRLNEFNRYQCK